MLIGNAVIKGSSRADPSTLHEETHYTLHAQIPKKNSFIKQTFDLSLFFCDAGSVLEELPVDQLSISLSPGHHIPVSTSPPARNASEIFLGAVTPAKASAVLAVPLALCFDRQFLHRTTMMMVRITRRKTDPSRTMATMINIWLIGGLVLRWSTEKNKPNVFLKCTRLSRCTLIHNDQIFILSL